MRVDQYLTGTVANPKPPEKKGIDPTTAERLRSQAAFLMNSGNATDFRRGHNRLALLGELPKSEKLEKRSGPTLGISKHLRGTPDDHDQSTHGRRGGGAPTIVSGPDLRTSRDALRFAPYGDDIDHAAKVIADLPMFEGWRQTIHTIPAPKVGVEMYRPPSVTQRAAVVWFQAEKSDPEHRAKFPEGYGAADDLVAQARVMEQLYNDPKGRRLWELPGQHITFTDAHLQGYIKGQGSLRAAGVHNDGAIKVAYKIDGRDRSYDQMYGTLVHELGHKLDWHLAKLGKMVPHHDPINSDTTDGWNSYWSYRHAPSQIADEFTRNLPLATPWAKIQHFVSGWWTSSRSTENPMSQRLLEKWSYPGRTRSPVEMFAETVEYWVREPRVLSDTVQAFNRHYEKNPDAIFNSSTGVTPLIYDGPIESSSDLSDLIDTVLTDTLKANDLTFGTHVEKADDDDRDQPLGIDWWIEGMNLEEIRLHRQYLANKAQKLTKHMGPGRHPSGSPQAVHGNSEAIREWFDGPDWKNMRVPIEEVQVGDWMRDSFHGATFRRVTGEPTFDSTHPANDFDDPDWPDPLRMWNVKFKRSFSSHVPKGVDVEIMRPITKHMGPGPHPSGSSQTVHRGGMLVGTQDTLFGEHTPNPVTNVTFSDWDTDSIVQTSKGRRFVGGYTKTSSFTDEEKAELLTAVEELEFYLGPDALPDNVKFVIGYDGFEEVVAWTWGHDAVSYGEDPTLVIINAAHYRSFDRDSIIAEAVGEPTFAAGKELIYESKDPFSSSVLWSEDRWDWLDSQLPTMRSRIVFHELIHIVDNKHNLSGSADIPHYNGQWFKEQVMYDDPSLPSAYAQSSEAEFLAESISDATFNENPAPISEITLEIVKARIAKDRDTVNELVNKHKIYVPGYNR